MQRFVSWRAPWMEEDRAHADWQTGREIGVMLIGSTRGSWILCPCGGERLGRGGDIWQPGPGRPATGGTEREHGNRACLAGLQLCPLKNPPRPSCHRDCCPWRCRCKRKAVAVAAPHPAVPFPWNAQAKKECWDDAVHGSPSKGSRERRLLRPPATSESPSVAPFSAVHAASAVHDWAASLRDSPTNFPAACWATPSASAHHHTKQPSHRPLAMTTFAKLPQVGDHCSWAASSVGSIANRSDEPGEPALIPPPCYL